MHMSVFRTAGRAVPDLLRPGDVVKLESTVPPGATMRLTLFLACSGYELGREHRRGVYTGDSSLREYIAEFVTKDRIVGCYDRVSRSSVVDLITEGTVHRTSDTATAEFVKPIQNAFCYVNIAYPNSLAYLSDDYDIDVWDALDLAYNHPRVDILLLGPGISWQCLPVNPHFLGGVRSGEPPLERD